MDITAIKRYQHTVSNVNMIHADVYTCWNAEDANKMGICESGDLSFRTLPEVR